MTVRTSKTSTLIDAVAQEAAARVERLQEESLGGDPTPQTEARLQDLEQREPFEDTDLFTYCQNGYVNKGIGIKYYIKKDGESLQSVKHSKEMSWDWLQAKYGGGSYTVRAKNIKTGMFIRQESETLADMEAEEEEQTSGFQFGNQGQEKSELSTLIMMMQQESRESRVRDEDRRREDRIRDEERRREDRENRNDLFKTLIPLAAPLLEKLLVKAPEQPRGIEPSVQLVIDSLKDSNRRLEDQMARASVANNSVLDTKMLLEMEQKARERESAARKEGREEMEKIYEIAEEKAETRAAEMMQNQGEKDETVTEALIKGIAPALGALFMQGKMGLPQMPQAAIEGPTTPGHAESEPVIETIPEASPSKASPGKVSVKGKGQKVKGPALSPDDFERKKIMDILTPLLVDAFTRMSNGVQLTPEGTARESLEQLKLKGYNQERTLELFTKAHMEHLVLKRLPEEYHPWFNRYYASLGTKPSTSSSTGSANTSFSGVSEVKDVESTGRDAG